MTNISKLLAKAGVASALACSVLLGGCASPAPNYDARFGEAVRATRQAQVLNPHPADNPDLVNGLDGGATQEAVKRYRDSFKAPPPVVNVINIGGSR